MKLSEKWLREWVNPSCSTEELCHVLTMAGLEVESCEGKSDDCVIELSITPNRGDCLSIQGVARDVSACTQTSMTIPSHIKKDIVKTHDALSNMSVTIEPSALKDCPRYYGRIIEDIKVETPTPDWMLKRLEACSLKTHNCIVDIMNYVMLELGQPMHAFDLDKIDTHQSSKSIRIRKAKVGETLLTLDNQTLELNETHCVISDSENALALAGIMGGLDSSVTMQTQSVFLESAFFNPTSISGVGRKFGIQSDSSFRFERGVDFNLPLQALNRASQLILEIAQGKASDIIECTHEEALPKIVPIALSYDRVVKLLGYAISIDSIQAILDSLGCLVELKETIFKVTPPSYRFDLKIEEDLIEEICRVVGYDNIPMSLPNFHTNPASSNEMQVPLARFKRALVDMGYTEAITYSFVSKEVQDLITPKEIGITLANPISSELSVMRTSIWPGLIGALRYNQARSQLAVQFFESGLRFRLVDDTLLQEPVLSGLIVGASGAPHWKSPARAFDFYDVKGHVESLFELTGANLKELEWQLSDHDALHPGQSAELFYKGIPLGVLGALHPRIAQSLSLEGNVFVFELLLEPFSLKKAFKFSRPSKYPSVTRDISMLLNADQAVGQVVGYIQEKGQPLLQKASVFDIYSGKGVEPGKKSVAIGLTFQHAERTLVEEEVDNLMQSLVAGLQSTFRAQLRE